MSVAEIQLKYMCGEISRTLGLEDATPADLVQAVRELMEYAEFLKSSRKDASYRKELADDNPLYLRRVGWSAEPR